MTTPQDCEACPDASLFTVGSIFAFCVLCLLFGVLVFSVFGCFVLLCVLVFGIVTAIQYCVAGPYAGITVGFIDAP